jgi:hypothetical protein
MSLARTVITLLNSQGLGMVAQIRGNLNTTSTNATGKTQQSLKFDVSQTGSVITLSITGRPYFMTVETGRKPTPDKKPSKSMLESIKEWMDIRGVSGSEWGIAMAIMKHGTKLYQKGGRKDIVSNVINDGMVARIEEEILKTLGNDILAQMLLAFNTNKKSA